MTRIKRLSYEYLKHLNIEQYNIALELYKRKF